MLVNFGRSHSIKIFLFLFLLLVTALGITQRCEEELKANLSSEMLLETATGRTAARVFKQAIELLEPAMPPLINTSVNVLSTEDPDYPILKFLADREALPAGWSEGVLEQHIWRQMLLKIVQWYDIPPISLSSKTISNQQLIDNLSMLIDSASQTKNPVVLAGIDNPQENKISFIAILTNDPPFPRLMVVKPPESIDISSSFQNIFPYISNCAQELSNYVYGPSEASRKIFLTHNNSVMYIFPTSSTDFENWLEVPQGEEISYLEFKHPQLVGVELYTTLFNGAGPGVMTIMQIIPQLRTNMLPKEILKFIQEIPR